MKYWISYKLPHLSKQMHWDYYLSWEVETAGNGNLLWIEIIKNALKYYNCVPELFPANSFKLFKDINLFSSCQKCLYPCRRFFSAQLDLSSPSSASYPQDDTTSQSASCSGNRSLCLTPFSTTDCGQLSCYALFLVGEEVQWAWTALFLSCSISDASAWSQVLSVLKGGMAFRSCFANWNGSDLELEFGRAYRSLHSLEDTWFDEVSRRLSFFGTREPLTALALPVVLQA